MIDNNDLKAFKIQSLFSKELYKFDNKLRVIRKLKILE